MISLPQKKKKEQQSEQQQQQKQQLEYRGKPVTVIENRNLEEINASIIEKEKQRQYEEEKKARQRDEEKLTVLILGSKHLASHIVYQMREVAKFVVVTNTDPAEIFSNPYCRHNVNRKLVTGYNVSEMDMEKNLENIIEASKVDFIVNTLTVHGAEYSAMNPIKTQYVNTVTTQAIMNAISNAHHNASLINISSDKVYGDQGCPAGVGRAVDAKAPAALADAGDHWHSRYKITERDHPNPLGLRAISRYNQENTVVQMAKTTGLRYLNLRIGNLYGEYTPRDNVWNNFFETALRDGFINVYGDKYASRDFVPISEVAKFIRDTMLNFDGGVWNDTYNIGGCEPTRQFIDGIALFVQTRISGSEVVGMKADWDLGYVKKYGSVKRRYLPARWFEDTEEARIRIWLDCTKAKEKLKYDPRLAAGSDSTTVQYNNMLFVAHYHMGLPTEELAEIKSKLQR